MSVIKKYVIIPSVRTALKKDLDEYLPSDIIYTLGGALFDRMNKVKGRASKEFYHKAAARAVKMSKNLRALEAQYYV